MIVKRVWIKKRFEKCPGFKTIMQSVTRHYEGWFLFGIIPLYIRNYETTYG